MSRKNFKYRNNKTNQHGSKGNNKGNRSESVDEKNKKDFNADFKKIESDGAPNDPDDYFTDLQLAEQATAVSVPQFLGTSPYMANIDLPTVEVIQVNPSIGVSKRNAGTSKMEASQSGAWMASQKLYTLLSINSGRTANYQQNDVLSAVVSVGQTVAMTEYIRRFFGVATTYSLRNRAYAVRLLSMLAQQSEVGTGIDNNRFGEDFIANMANYRMRANMIITKINQIPIIANMGYLRRCVRMFQSIYIDTESPMAQTYAFAPFSTWVIDESSRPSTVLSTRLISNDQSLVGGINTMSDLLDILDEMVNALLNSTTLNYVYADILNYASKYSMVLFTLDYITEGYAVVPTLEPRMNEIKHNLMLTGLPMSLGAGLSDYFTNENDVNLDVTSGSIFFAPCFGALSMGNANKLVKFKSVPIDFQTGNPDLTSRVDAYRMKYLPAFLVSNASGSYVTYLTAEALPDWYPVQTITYGVDANQFFTRRSKIASYSSGTRYEYSSYGTAGTPINPHGTEFSTAGSQFFGDAATLNFTTPQLTLTDLEADWSYVSGGDINFMTYQDNERFRLMFDLEAQGLLDFRMK